MNLSDPRPEQLQVDALAIRLFDDRRQLGREAAAAVAALIRDLQTRKEEINIIFAAAPSQNELLAALRDDPGIQWSRINAFHMDEYVGLPADAPQNFGYFLKTRLFDIAKPKAVFYLDGNATDPEEECTRYAALLRKYPADLVCMGIGENCHIAFNDPFKADFEDEALVRRVELDLESREQQVNDGCFTQLAEVPVYALTLTVPALLAAPALFVVVPGKSKATAIRQTLLEPISNAHPSTILRRHPEATLFIDRDSAAGFLEKTAE